MPASFFFAFLVLCSLGQKSGVEGGRGFDSSPLVFPINSSSSSSLTVDRPFPNPSQLPQEFVEDKHVELTYKNERQQVEPEDPLVEIYYKAIDIMEDEQIQLQQYSVFYLNVFTIGNKTLDLEGLIMLYYFEGGENNLQPEDFNAACIDSKPLLCSNVTLNIARGQTGYPGAQNVLLIGFTNSTGYLLAEDYFSEVPRAYIIEQTGDSAYSKISLIIAIQSNSASNLMDISRDYSYVDAPLVGIQNVTDGEQVSIRSEIPTKKIRTYFGGELVAGIRPWQG